jgi:clan AA aspartic protease (TIGR02281 family)
MQGVSRLVVLLFSLVLSTGNAFAVPAPAAPTQEEVALEDDGGTFRVPVLINGAVRLSFTIDSGASVVSVPADVALTLVRTGTVTKADFIGTQTFTLADGTSVPSPMFRIRSLQVGNIELRDVEASITDIKGSLLLGQSFLSRLSSWSIDNQRHALVMVGLGQTIVGPSRATQPPIVSAPMTIAPAANIDVPLAAAADEDASLGPQSSKWDANTHDSCVPSAMRNGASAAVAHEYCKCMVSSFDELPVRRKLSLTPQSPEFIRAASDCNVQSLAPMQTGSIFDYGHMPDAKIVVQGRTVEITVHTRRDTLLVRPTLAESWNFADSVTKWPPALYREAAEAFVEPLGCSIESIEVVLKPNYEVAFFCPPGVDLHARVFEQRAALASGAPLRP